MSQKIDCSMSGLLNEYIIKLLNKKGINTVTEFLQEDANRLMSTINVDLYDISVIKNDIFKECGIQPVEGLSDYQNFLMKGPCLATKIRNLDTLLKGGFAIGNLIDICGLSAAGKTQLCTTIAINLAQYCDIQTYFIDAKGDFSAKRIHKILENRMCNEMDIHRILQGIHVERINDVYDLINILKQLIMAPRNDKFKMLVIDSLPALWFQFHGDKSSKGLNLLATAANLMRKLSVELGVVVLTVNIITQWIPTVSGERLSSSSTNSTQLSLSISKPSQTKYTPALGKYWHSICSTRLLINATSNEIANTQRYAVDASHKNTTQRFIHIVKSNQYKTGSNCSVEITDIGIC